MKPHTKLDKPNSPPHNLLEAERTKKKYLLFQPDFINYAGSFAVYFSSGYFFFYRKKRKSFFFSLMQTFQPKTELPECKLSINSIKVGHSKNVLA